MNEQENKLYHIYEFQWVDCKGFYSHATVSGESPREAFGFLETRLREKSCDYDIDKRTLRIKRPPTKVDKKGVIEGFSYYNEINL